MVQFKISQLILAGAVSMACVIGVGTAAGASAPVSTAAVPCAEGALIVVTDDSGGQVPACVAVGEAVAPPIATAPAPATAAAEAESLVAPVEVAPATKAAELPQTGASNDSLLIAALLVGSGSIASIVSRRKR